MSAARYGDVWLADLNPTRGREQAGLRPVLILSHDIFNQGPADLIIVLPMTSTWRGIASHVEVSPPEGGLKQPSTILCEAIRSISKQRLLTCWGQVSHTTMQKVADRLRILLNL